MKERPILFSAPMVRAILSGAKTQTRRAVKPQSSPCCGVVTLFAGTAHMGTSVVRCPFGVPGDRLWVRETWRVGAWRDDGRVALDFAASPDLVRTPWLRPPAEAFKGLAAQGLDDCRRAAARGALSIEEHADGRFTWPHGASPCRWRPSIHMPRWASRLTLEVTDVRVERLNDINEDDAEAEGVVEFSYGKAGDVWLNCTRDPEWPDTRDPREVFAWLCGNINGVGSWEANPWVWVVSFKRVTP